jgi:hypothetical protein
MGKNGREWTGEREREKKSEGGGEGLPPLPTSGSGGKEAAGGGALWGAAELLLESPGDKTRGSESQLSK